MNMRDHITGVAWTGCVLLASFFLMNSFVKREVEAEFSEPSYTFDIPAYTVIPDDLLRDGEINLDGTKVWLNDDMRLLLKSWNDRSGQLFTAPAVTLRICTLNKPLSNRAILEALIGRGDRVSFASIFWLINQQDRGEPGLLPTDGQALIFFPKEFPGWAIDVRRISDDGRWHLYASGADATFLWRPGISVLFQ